MIPLNPHQICIENAIITRSTFLTSVKVKSKIKSKVKMNTKLPKKARAAPNETSSTLLSRKKSVQTTNTANRSLFLKHSTLYKNCIISYNVLLWHIIWRNTHLSWVASTAQQPPSKIIAAHVNMSVIGLLELNRNEGNTTTKIAKIPEAKRNIPAQKRIVDPQKSIFWERLDKVRRIYRHGNQEWRP